VPAFRFTAKQQREFLEKIREGVQRGAAAEELGLDRFETRRFIEGHPDFEERIQDAEEDALEHVKEAIYAAAVSGSVPAAKLWLEAHGVEFAEHRGRPRNPDEPPLEGEDNFSDFASVVRIDRRRDKKA
jgi:DNA-directed RNA polymerase subunit N (RpoN/RPB10)